MTTMPRVLYQFKERAGKPFRPSNGTEGECFEGAFCYKCFINKPYIDDSDNDPCEINCAAFWHDIDDEEYPDQWVFDSEGWPVCTAFVRIEQSKE